MPFAQAYVGTNSVGGSAWTPLSDKMYVKSVSITGGSLLASVDVAVDTTNGEDIGFQFVVYSDNAGAPGNLIGICQNQANSVRYDGTTHWVSGPVGMWFAATTTVWIGVHVRDPGTATIAYATSGSDYEIDAGGAWAIESTALGGSQASTTRNHSIRGSVVSGLSGSQVGDVSAGASTLTMVSGRFYATKLAFTAGDFVASVSAQIRQGTNNITQLYVVIWDDNAGSPGSIVYAGPNAGTSQLLSTSTLREMVLPVGMKVRSTGDYWVGISKSGSNSTVISYDAATGSDGYIASDSDAAAFTNETRRYAIAANVVTSTDTVTDLGESSIGGSDQTTANTTAYAIPITVPADGLLVGIEAGMRAASTTQTADPVWALYEDNAGAPGALIASLGQRSDEPVIGTTARWLSLPVMQWLASGSYWIGWGSVAGNARLAYSAGSSGDGYTVANGAVEGVGEPGATSVTSTATANVYSLRATFVHAAISPGGGGNRMGGDKAIRKPPRKPKPPQAGGGQGGGNDGGGGNGGGNGGGRPSRPGGGGGGGGGVSPTPVSRRAAPRGWPRRCRNCR